MGFKAKAYGRQYSNKVKFKRRETFKGELMSATGRQKYEQLRNVENQALQIKKQ